ncbi:MAG: SgcJ/EcaC family oxidoreductase [Chloroflexi bacterium]|nr:MAG: SgcJ/EcaC family oxidoreductase [Chloroflexota bacterium]
MAQKQAEVARLTDEQQITHLMDEWRRLTSEGNVDGLLSLLSDDVIFLTPANAPITKQDFAAGFREVAAKARIESTQEVKDLRVSGNIAYAWSYLTVVLIPKDGDKRSESSGHVLSVYQRSPSGSWRLSRDANLVAGAGNPDRV